MRLLGILAFFLLLIFSFQVPVFQPIQTEEVVEVVPSEEGVMKTTHPAWPTGFERGAYRAFVEDTRDVLWDVDWTTQIKAEGGRLWVEVEEHGEGQPWGYEVPMSWIKRMAVQLEPTQQAMYLSGERRDLDTGELRDQFDAQVKPDKGVIEYHLERRGKRDLNKKLDWDPSLLPDEMLFHWSRTLAFTENPSGNARLMVSPKSVFKVKFENQGTETITVPAGTFECYRLKIIPSGGGIGGAALKMFFPELWIWCAVDAPNHWVKYIGPTGGPGSPTASIELVSLEMDAPETP